MHYSIIFLACHHSNTLPLNSSKQAGLGRAMYVNAADIEATTLCLAFIHNYTVVHGTIYTTAQTVNMYHVIHDMLTT